MYLYVANAESSCLSRRQTNPLPAACAWTKIGHNQTRSLWSLISTLTSMSVWVEQSGNRAPMADLFGCVVACLDAMCHGGAQRLMILGNPKPIGHLET